jgi:hypothetical protein
MKWITILTIAAVVAAFGTASADYDDDALMEVFVEVEANMSVMPGAPFVDMSTVQVGPIVGYVPFIVDANTQTCKFMAAASKLYKGDDPTDPEVPPIELDESAGILFTIPDGDATGGGDGVAAYCCPATINGFPGMSTEWVEFESSQNNRLSQTVTLEITWIQDDPEKPMGEYSGFVEFFAMIVLP